MYSPEGSEEGGGSFPRRRGEEEAAFSRSRSQRMQNKLRDVCLDPHILRKEKRKKSGGKGHMYSLIAQGASCILASLGEWRCACPCSYT